MTRDRLAFLALGAVLGAAGALLFRGAAAGPSLESARETAETARLERRITELEALAKRPAELAAPPPPPGVRPEAGPRATEDDASRAGVPERAGPRDRAAPAGETDGTTAPGATPPVATELVRALGRGAAWRLGPDGSITAGPVVALPDWDAATTESKWRYGTDEEKAKALARMQAANSEEFLPVLRRALDPVPTAPGAAAGISNAIARLKDRPWSAKQATGAPDTPVAGDIGSAWASARADMGEVTLDLTYDRAVRVDAVRIHETHRPGAIAKLQAKRPDGSWDTIWEGRSTAFDSPNWFAPAVAATSYATNAIRIVVDTDRVEDWNEIDAVELEGDGIRQWASGASASSSYADR